MSDTRVAVGVSACLLGERVRYDGDHKLVPALTGDLIDEVRWVPVCPEVEIGMGVPREPVRLEGDAAAPRMVGTGSGRDWTDAMNAFGAACVERLVSEGIGGYVFKARSPSCGLAGVPVGGAEGRGLFAAALTERLPGLPVAEEADLADDGALQRFVDRARAYVH